MNIDDYKRYRGVLVESGKRISFTQYLGLPELKIGDWCNCLDKKDLHQKYCLIEVDENEIYYFKKVFYENE